MAPPLIPEALVKEVLLRVSSVYWAYIAPPWLLEKEEERIDTIPPVACRVPSIAGDEVSDMETEMSVRLLLWAKFMNAPAADQA